MFSWLFPQKQKQSVLQKYSFGRFISEKRSEEQSLEYQNSKKAFKEQRFIDGYEHYFKYLNFSAQETSNVSFTKSKNSLKFKIIQGSCIINGDITNTRLQAKINLVRIVKNNVAVMRRLLEKNYMYTYSSYYIEDETVKSKIFCDNISLSPQKVFFPLRELAINSDKEKELLLDEFNDLEAVEIDHIEVTDSNLKDTKLRFFREWIDKTEQHVILLPSQEQSGAIAFVWLSLLLKIDYFVTPRGKIGYEIYEAISEYYIDDNKLVEEKNDSLNKAVIKLKELDTHKLSKSVYDVTQTFDIFNENSIEDIYSFIDETLGKASWYKEHKYEEIMLSIYEYLGLYMLYNFGMNECLRELTQLNVQLHNTDFYKALGLNTLGSDDDTLKEKKISAKIVNIIKPYTKEYPHLESFDDMLNYDSLEKFHHSYFSCLKNLNFSEL